jgi:hypothetical protein
MRWTLPIPASAAARPAICTATAISDDRLVTVAVPELTPEDRAVALEAGLRAAEAFRSRRLIEGAALFLQGERRVTGALALEMGDASG